MKVLKEQAKRAFSAFEITTNRDSFSNVAETWWQHAR